MITFALEYRVAIDSLTADCDMKLQAYEMSRNDWDIITHLRDTLKVNFYIVICSVAH